MAAHPGLLETLSPDSRTKGPKPDPSHHIGFGPFDLGKPFRRLPDQTYLSCLATYFAYIAGR